MTFRSVRVRLSLGMAPASADQQFHLNVWRHSGTLAQPSAISARVGGVSYKIKPACSNRHHPTNGLGGHERRAGSH
jgi:hypothetical protein